MPLINRLLAPARYLSTFLPSESTAPLTKRYPHPPPRPFTTTATFNMRLPYIPDDPQMETEEDAAIVQRVKDRRGGKLIALDKTLLHAPAVASGWGTKIRRDTPSLLSHY
jgi:hypothetical protein